MPDSKLLLLDGHSLAYRAFFGLPVENFTTSTGQVTNAVYGFTSMFLNLLRDETPTHIAVAFDVSRKTFRTELFSEYKATRSASPAEFKGQVELIIDVLKALNVTVLQKDGFEADDLIATLATQGVREGMEVVISSGDRDTFQLISKNITVLYPKKGVSDLARMTPAAVIEKYGLSAEQYPDYAALRGDPSDNLPGIPGVGEKTAAKWIVQYGSLEKLLDHAEEIGGKVGAALLTSIEQVRLNRELTALRKDVELDVEIKNLKFSPAEGSRITELFEALEFRAFKDRIKPFIEPTMEKPIDLPTVQVTACAFGFDVIDLFDGKEHKQGSISEFEKILRDPKIPKVVHGLKEINKKISIKGVVGDTEIENYLLAPGSAVQDLSELAERVLGQRVSQNDELMLELNPEILQREAEIIYALHSYSLTKLQGDRLDQLEKNLELPLALVLSEMEQHGIAVNADYLESLRSDFAKTADAASEAASKVAGYPINLASPKQLQVLLFDELKLPKTKKNKTGYTTDSDAIDWLQESHPHPILECIKKHREFSKLKSIVEGLIKSIAQDGRIHTTLAQTVTATGRLSSVDPNLQNIPVRTEDGRRIRSAFIAGAGYQRLITADYSQIEMRIMAHLSEDAGLIAAFDSGEDLHTTVATQVFGVAASEVSAEMRRQIKAMSYGLAYGLSTFGLAAQLGLSDAEARELRESYFGRFGGIRDYLKGVVEKAREDGFTQTLLGRRRYLPDLRSDNRQRREMAERMALNAPIQGSAADIVKLAMLGVDRALKAEKLKSRLLLQIHDELIVEVPDGEDDQVVQILRKQMGSAYDLKVALDVNIGIGKNWDEGAH